MKGNAKCKNVVLSHLLGDLRVTHRVHLWLDGKRIVDFLLAIIEFLASSYSCGIIKRNLSNSTFSEGVGHYEHKSQAAQ